MRRKEFIRNTGLASLTAALPLNGLMASLVNNLPIPLVDCDVVNDRILVIVRLAGANDGLNMFVPLNQYDQYSALRPNIKLNNVNQANGIINLDSSLPSNQQIGLHPIMTGLKSLYDAGKVNIINSIGYPNFNYSHFDAENILWAGKDGNYIGAYDEGMIGKFLNSAFPNISGHPSPSFSDPLVLHFGSSNPILSFVHDHGTGTVEYNTGNLQPLFNGSLNLRQAIPSNSDYYSLLNYITSIEQSMDLYYNRVLECFSTGANSTVTYPSTHLGRQMKSIARLIKGGSKTKIFQSTIEGFDLHGGQVVAGATNTGSHAVLLNDLSLSLKAFYDDINNMGFGNKVLTITFSEFGRKPMQNGSLGTDHGNISPMIIIGNGLNPGITGVNPNLNNVTSAPDGRFFESERQFDYRQVYSTLFQDWLGASNNVLTQTGINGFSKLNLIQTTQNASPSCVRDTFLDVCTGFKNVVNTVLLQTNTSSGWTYFSIPGNNDYVYAVELTPSGVGANTNSVVLEVTISNLMCSPNDINCFVKSNNQEGTFGASTYFNVKAVTGNLNGWVNIRWFVNPLILSDLEAAAQGFKNTSGANYISPLMWLKKKESKLKLNDNLRDDGAGLVYGIDVMQSGGTGILNGQSYNQFNNVSNLQGTGGGVFIRVSNLPETNGLYQFPPPVNDPVSKGQIRFNKLTKTFEGHDGIMWKPLH